MGNKYPLFPDLCALHDLYKKLFFKKLGWPLRASGEVAQNLNGHMQLRITKSVLVRPLSFSSNESVKLLKESSILTEILNAFILDVRVKLR